MRIASREVEMSDEIKGKLDNLKGRAKQAVGAAIGNKRMEAEGAAERAKGVVEEKAGEVKRKLDEDEPEGSLEDESDNDEV
jgi:uncharacterized protein YjbJ (UPF0337 family)